MNFKILLLILLSALLLCSIWFRDGNFLATAEGGIPFYNLEHQYEAVRYSWAEPGLGTPTGLVTASAPTYWVLKQLHSAGLSEVFLEAAVFFILLFVSGLSIFLLTKLLFPEIPDWLVFFGVLFYWFNPFALVNVWNRFLLGYMAFYTLLPLSFYLYLRGLIYKKYIYTLIIPIVTVFFSYSLTSLPFNSVLFLLFAYSSFFFFLTAKKEKTFFYFNFFILTLIVYVLVHAWWLTQFFGFVLSSAFNLSVSSFHSSSDSLSSLTTISSKLGKISEIITFSHEPFFKEGLSWARFYQFPVVHLIQFFAPLMILWSIVKDYKRREVLFLSTLFFIVIFLMKGNASPFGEVFHKAYDASFLLRIFRNPFEKFGFLITLTTPLIIYGLYLFYKKRNLLYKKVLIIFCILYFGIYLSWPFLTSLVFTWNNTEEPDKSVSYEVKVPEYYKEVNQWLNDQISDFRVMSLPIAGEGMTYTWDKGYSGVELSSVLIDKPSISNNTTVPLYNELVQDAINSQVSPGFLNFMPFVNAKYIVWRGDVNYTERNLPDPRFIKDRLDLWEKEGLIRKQFHKGQIAVYEVNKQYQWPKIYTTSAIINSNQADISYFKEIDSRFPNLKPVLINPSANSYPVGLSDLYMVKPKNLYIYTSFADLNKLSDQELIHRIVYVKYLPGEKIYLLIRLKEQIEHWSKKDEKERILYEINLLNKRAVEIYHLKGKNASNAILRQAEKDYLDMLGDLISRDNIASQKSPVFHEINNSLKAHYVLFNRVGFSEIDKLKNKLIGVNVIPLYDLSYSNEGRFLVYLFEIPREGYFQIVPADQFKGAGVLIDGINMDQAINSSDGSFYLNQGTHEISIFMTDKMYLSEVLQKQDMVLSQDPKNLQFALSDRLETYQVQFYYLFKKGIGFNVVAKPDNTYLSQASINSRIIKNNYFHGWNFWSNEFESLPGAKNVTLLLSVDKQQKCQGILFFSKCEKVWTDTEVEIKDLIINKVNKPRIILKSSGQINEVTEPTKTSFRKINPTLYEVSINKSSNQKEVLVFSELFNSNWELETIGNKPVDAEHILVNNYANGWVINNPGEHLFQIRFKNQVLLDISKIVSMLSILIISSGLVIKTLLRKYF